MISTKILATVAILFGTIAIGAFSFIGNVSANDTGSRASLIDRLVSKFNLNKNDVESVFSEHQVDRQANMQEQFANRLAEAVKEGKITDAKKSLIMTKHDELQREHKASFEARKNMTQEERKAFRKQRREELNNWLNANDIPEGIFGLGMGKGRGGHEKWSGQHS